MKRKNIILIPCFIIALILIGLIVIKTNTSKETDNIEQKSTTETTKPSNQNTNNNEEKEVSKGSTTSSSEHSNQSEE